MFLRGNFGAQIGTTHVGTPTCADDTEMQTMYDILQDYASKRRSVLNPDKSNVLMKAPNKQPCADYISIHFFLNE